MADWVEIDEAMRRLVGHDASAEAWQALVALLDPALAQLARGQSIGRLKSRPDAVRDICVRVIEKLHKNDHAVLRDLYALDAPPNVRSWLRVVVRRAAIDYMRSRPEYNRSASPSKPHWVSVVSLRTGDGFESADSLVEKRNTVLSDIESAAAEAAQRFAEVGEDAYGQLAASWQVPRLFVRRLVKKGELFVPVLNLFFQGETHTEIAKRLATSRREVELCIQYVEEFLRARYQT